MIDSALDFLQIELNEYLKTVFGNGNWVVLSSIATANGIGIPSKKLGLSLINIEEERIFKDQRTAFPSTNGEIDYHNPDLRLNLYVLITANFNDKTPQSPDYKEGLKQLSQVIRFFQSKYVFTPDNTALLANYPDISRLIVELYSFSFEQLYNFWSVVGTSYLPSVLYRVRLVTIQEKKIIAPGSIIREISLESSPN